MKSLIDLPAVDDETGEVRVVIETPRGSRNKYKYNGACDCLEVKRVLPEGMAFPHDFGFVPSTKSGDGDPIDVLLFSDAPIVAGAMVSARLIGVHEVRQKEKGGDWERNDRLLAVATLSREHESIERLSDLADHVNEDIKAFFKQYNTLSGKKYEELGEHGPKKARDLFEQAMATYERSRAKERSSNQKEKHHPRRLVPAPRY